MNWQFWKKDNLLLNKLKDMEEKFTVLENTVSELSNNNKQMTRLQYKNNQEIKKALASLNKRSEDQQRNEELIIDYYRSIINNNIDTLINMIDEIDIIREGLNGNEDKWSQVLEKWIAVLLNSLEKQGIYELKLSGKQFDPRAAEAISTLSKNEIKMDQEWTGPTYKNHDIIKVLKRGYRDGNGHLIRKASVITIKEENNEQGEI